MSNEKKGTGMATASLVLGIIAVVLGLLPLLSGWFLVLFWAVWILAILAIVFGIIALCKKQSVVKPVIGMLLSILGCAAPSIFADAYADNAKEMVRDAYEMAEENGVDVESLQYDFE